MVGYLDLLNIGIMKRCKAMLQICVYRGRLVVVLEKRSWVLNHEKNFLLRRYVVALAFRVRYNKSPSRWSIPVQPPEKGEQALVFDHRLALSYTAYICCSIVGNDTFEDIIPYTKSVTRTPAKSAP